MYNCGPLHIHPNGSFHLASATTADASEESQRPGCFVVGTDLFSLAEGHLLFKAHQASSSWLDSVQEVPILAFVEYFVDDMLAAPHTSVESQVS